MLQVNVLQRLVISLTYKLPAIEIMGETLYNPMQLQAFPFQCWHIWFHRVLKLLMHKLLAWFYLGNSSCKRTPPSLTWDASTCKVIGFEVSKYIKHVSLLILSFNLWKLTSWLSVHWNKAFLLSSKPHVKC